MREYFKVGTIAFALVALAVAMTQASMTACASPEPKVPEAAEGKSSPPPSAESEPEAEYFPASKSGGFMPQERRRKKK